MDSALRQDRYTTHQCLWTGNISGSNGMEYIVPDSMPDIESILDAEALVSIRSKEVNNGRLRIACDVAVSIFYQPMEGAAPGFLSLSFDCEGSASAPEIDSESQCIASPRLRSVEVKVINSRKISITAELAGTASCYRRSEICLSRPTEANDGPLEIRMAKAELCLIPDIREKTFVLTDDYSLPGSMQSVDRIAMQRVMLECQECEYVADKLVFRGRARVFLLLCQGDELFPCGYESNFSQIVDIEAAPEPAPEITLLLTGAYFDLPEHSGGSIAAELHLLAQIKSWSRACPDYVADAYCNSKCVIPQLQTDTVCTAVRTTDIERSLTAQTDLPPDAASILYTKTNPGSLSIKENELILNAGVKAVYRRRDGRFGCTNLRLKESFAADMAADESLRVQDIRFGDCLSSLSGDKLDIRLPLQIRLRIHREQELTHVEAVSESEEPLPEVPSVTLRRVGQDCDLWTLAKEHRSSVKAIRTANQGREEGLLLIPRLR